MDDKDEKLVNLMVSNLREVFDEKLDDISDKLEKVIAKQDEASDSVKELGFKAERNEEAHRDIVEMHHENASFNKLLDGRIRKLEEDCGPTKDKIKSMEDDILCAKKKNIKFWLTISENWMRITLFITPWITFFLLVFLFAFSSRFQIKIIETLMNLLSKGL